MIRTGLFTLSLAASLLVLSSAAHAVDPSNPNLPGHPGGVRVGSLDRDGNAAGYDYPGIYAGRFDGIDKGSAARGVNVAAGFITNNRDDAPGGRPRNLGSLAGIGSTNELGRAGFAAAPGKQHAPGFGGGVRVAVGDVNGDSGPQIPSLTGAAIEPVDPTSPTVVFVGGSRRVVDDGAGGVRVAVGDVTGDSAQPGVGGRITGIAVDPSDPSGAARHHDGVVNRVAQGQVDAAGDGNTIYVATAGGGAWKTKDGGQTWQPQGQPRQGGAGNTGALESLSGANTWAGNAAAGQDRFYGTGVYKSTDSGRTWNMPPTPSQNAGALKTTNGGAATDSRPGMGILKSTDGGQTLNQRTLAPGLKAK